MPSLAPRATELRPVAEHRMELRAVHSSRSRHGVAWQDVQQGLVQWRLATTLGWLDIKLRYRGSVLGPFWLTLSTAVMVIAMGILYSQLFRMQMRDYLPFLALSLVLWNTLSALVGEACTCFTSAEGTIRSVRMPFIIHAGRTVVRNALVLCHTVVVILGVFAFYDTWPGFAGFQSLVGLALWLVDATAACLLLGALCARFRDIAPIIGSVMQIAFFITPVIWRPELIGNEARWLVLNPFYPMLALVRDPLLHQSPDATVWLSALMWSGLLCSASWMLFARVRSRLAFWV